MLTFGLCLIAFFAAFGVTYVSVFNSKKFSNLFFLIYGSPVVIIYCIIYGLIGVVLFLTLKENTLIIKQHNTNLTSPYFSSFLVGVATKGLTELKFFDIRHADESFPIGLKTIFHFIDTRFDEVCDSICFDRFHVFISQYRGRYKDVNLDLFKKQIVDILSSHPSSEKVENFSKKVIARAKGHTDILNEIVKVFGKRTLNTIITNVSAES
jgi:hypothetical protein